MSRFLLHYFSQPQHQFSSADFLDLASSFWRRLRSQQQQLANILETWKKETGDDQPADLTPDWSDRWTNKPVPEKDKRGNMPGALQNATSIQKPGPF